MKKRILIVEDDRPTRYLLSRVLRREGFLVVTAADGAAGLRRARNEKFDLILLDIWLPRMNGLEVLAQLRADGTAARVVVMTSDTTPQTLLRAVREQAYQYVSKPVEAHALVEVAKAALAASPAGPIEVLSTRPDWVELLVPCEMGAAERVENLIARLEADLPAETRHSVGQVFHEMLTNAIEWGGRLDPNRKVRISCLRTNRMLLYRIADPGPGFKFDELPHAAVSYAPDQLLEHVSVRQKKGLRPGGFGILLARAMVDELIYNEAHNEVVCVKYLD